MRGLLEGLRLFRNGVLPRDDDSYGSRGGRSPECMLIACNDSGISVNVAPGDCYVHPCVGNLIPQHPLDPNDVPPGEASRTIEFAVKRLHVKHIIVVGHSECGAMSTFWRHFDQQGGRPIEPTDLGFNLADSLQHAAPALIHFADRDYDDFIKFEDETAEYNKLAMLNVLVQMEHLYSYPEVANRVERGVLRIHGWFFDVSKHQVKYYDTEEKRFLLIDEDVEAQLEADMELVRETWTEVFGSKAAIGPRRRKKVPHAPGEVVKYRGMVDEDDGKWPGDTMSEEGSVPTVEDRSGSESNSSERALSDRAASDDDLTAMAASDAGNHAHAHAHDCSHHVHPYMTIKSLKSLRMDVTQDLAAVGTCPDAEGESLNAGGSAEPSSTVESNTGDELNVSQGAHVEEVIAVPSDESVSADGLDTPAVASEECQLSSVEAEIEAADATQTAPEQGHEVVEATVEANGATLETENQKVVDGLQLEAASSAVTEDAHTQQSPAAAVAVLMDAVVPIAGAAPAPAEEAHSAEQAADMVALGQGVKQLRDLFESSAVGQTPSPPKAVPVKVAGIRPTDTPASAAATPVSTTDARPSPDDAPSVTPEEPARDGDSSDLGGRRFSLSSPRTSAMAPELRARSMSESGLESACSDAEPSTAGPTVRKADTGSSIKAALAAATHPETVATIKAQLSAATPKVEAVVSRATAPVVIVKSRVVPAALPVSQVAPVAKPDTAQPVAPVVAADEEDGSVVDYDSDRDRVGVLRAAVAPTAPPSAAKIAAPVFVPASERLSAGDSSARSSPRSTWSASSWTTATSSESLYDKVKAAAAAASSKPLSRTQSSTSSSASLKAAASTAKPVAMTAGLGGAASAATIKPVPKAVPAVPILLAEHLKPSAIPKSAPAAAAPAPPVPLFRAATVPTPSSSAKTDIHSAAELVRVLPKVSTDRMEVPASKVPLVDTKPALPGWMLPPDATRGEKLGGAAQPPATVPTALLSKGERLKARDVSVSRARTPKEPAPAVPHRRSTRSHHAHSWDVEERMIADALAELSSSAPSESEDDSGSLSALVSLVAKVFSDTSNKKKKSPRRMRREAELKEMVMTLVGRPISTRPLPIAEVDEEEETEDSEATWEDPRTVREREREHERQREKELDRQQQLDREREAERERQRQWELERERERERQAQAAAAAAALEKDKQRRHRSSHARHAPQPERTEPKKSFLESIGLKLPAPVVLIFCAATAIMLDGKK